MNRSFYGVILIMFIALVNGSQAMTTAWSVVDTLDLSGVTHLDITPDGNLRETVYTGLVKYTLQF